MSKEDKRIERMIILRELETILVHVKEMINSSDTQERQKVIDEAESLLKLIDNLEKE